MVHWWWTAWDSAAMARDAVCEECSGPNYGGKVTELPPGVCAEPGADGHLPEGAKQAAKCTSCRSDAGYCTKLGVAGHLTEDRCAKIPTRKTPAKSASSAAKRKGSATPSRRSVLCAHSFFEWSMID